MSATSPLRRRLGPRFRQMLDCNARPHQGVQHSVEMDQSRWRPVAGPFAISAQQVPLDFMVTKTVAFEAEIGDLAEGIELPQVCAKLQTVDDARGAGQIDVLGPQIAVTVDDTAVLK